MLYKKDIEKFLEKACIVLGISAFILSILCLVQVQRMEALKKEVINFQISLEKEKYQIPEQIKLAGM